MLQRLIDSLATDGAALVMADAVVKATVLLCLTAVIAALLRRSAAALRHRLWALALFGLIVLPLSSWLIPGRRLSILPPTAGFFSTQAPWNERGDAESPDAIHSTQPGFDQSRIGPMQALRPGDPKRSFGTSSRVSPVIQSHVARSAAMRGSAWVMLLWAPGFIAVAWPTLAGVAGNERRRRQSLRVVDPTWLQLLDGSIRQFALRRQVELRTSHIPLIPMTWGILRPVVLLPEKAQQWPEPARRLVLLHELAHIKRYDVGFQLIGRLATSIFWFHPLAWYALHRLRTECECACDDYAVHLGARRTDYARQLVELARTLRGTNLSAAVPLTRKNTLEQRIKALLDDGRSHRLLGKSPAWGLLAGALVLMTGLAAVHTGASEVQPFVTAPPPTTASTKEARNERETVTPATVAPASEKTTVARPEESLPESYTHPITVSGRAFDLAGKPISGVRVYLASRRADYKRIAETVTDAEGRYGFREVPLPIERAKTVSGRNTGSFEVFGEAEGLGFAWRPQKWFFPQPKPASITYEPDRRDPPSRYEAQDKIVLDLNFPPAARLSGTIADDRGNLLADVRLEIRECESLNIVDNVMPGWTFDTLNESDSAPPSMKVRTTDAQGRFEFTELPVDCRFGIDLRVKGFPWRRVYAATTREPQPNHDGSPVLTGDLKVALTTPLDVPVKIVFGDTGEPAPKVAVEAGEGLVNTLETTDDEGRVTLRLPTGKYRTRYLPARGTPYLATAGELVVGTEPPAEPVVASLHPAGVVEVTVVDAETGAGIPDVDLWRQTKPDDPREILFFRSWEAATRIAWVEKPLTNARGKLRALVEPGTSRIGVGLQSYPPNREVVESEGREVECRPGETVQLKFIMRKRR